jgi:hypothetical protein
VSDAPADFRDLDALIETFPPSANAPGTPGLHATPAVTIPLSTEPPRQAPAAPRGIDDYLDAVLRRAASRGRDGAPFVAALSQQLLRAQEFVNPYETGPSLVILDAPTRAAGGWIVQLAERAGGRSILNPSRIPAHLGAILEAQPDALLLLGSPAGTPAEPWAEFTRHPDWPALAAVRAGRAAWLPDMPTLASAMWFLTGWLQSRPEIIPSDVLWWTHRDGAWVRPS